MSDFITDTFAGPLAKRLAAIKADHVVGKGLDAAAGDAREALDAKTTEAGYYDVAESLQTISEGKYTRVVGLAKGHPSYKQAHNMEFGSIDHSHDPKGIFRLHQDEFAANASETIARVLEGLVGA